MHIDAKVERWLDAALHDRDFGWLCRGLTHNLVVGTSTRGHGILLAAEPRRLDAAGIDRPDIRIAAADESWARILTDIPDPGYQSFGAWLRHDIGLTVEADPLIQAQALAALERLVELTRPQVSADPLSAERYDEAAIIGRRRSVLRENGDFCRLHWREAGAGTPIVFLHTAGADGRQFRYQMADRELQDRFSMYAFDMPWHGGSGGVDDRTSTADYRLAEDDYLAWVSAFLEKVVQRPAIVIGCSMGAEMALTVTAHRPDLVIGCIACEAPLKAPGRRSPFMADARVAYGLHNPAFVRALLSPTAPQRFRDEACVIYEQARPGIYMGDLAYYSDDFDGAAIAGGLRAANREIVLLTGSYDYSATPANTRALHAAIDHDRASFTEMPGLGHFPMIEDPDRFRPYLLRALERVQSTAN